MGKFKKLITNWRIIILMVFLVLALVAIHPNPWSDGVAIRSVMKDSAAALGGIQSPKPTTTPMARERVLSINNEPVHTLEDYTKITSSISYNQTIIIKTTKDSYRITTKPAIVRIELDEKVPKQITSEVFNESINRTLNVTRVEYVNKVLENINGTEDLGLRVYEAPKTNLRKGLELSGGTRVLLEPETELSPDEMDILISNMKERLNVYGLSDIVVRQVNDLSGKKFVLVEIAGASDEEVKDLLAKQGKFEAKIGNESTFRGGNDIKYVCRSADCAGIDPTSGCGRVSSGDWSCKFRFSITLSPEAAQRQADITKDIPVKVENGEGYLTLPIDLYLDDELVDSLSISESLKGKAETEIAISGGGLGNNQQEAITESLKNMKKLQTILITGSLPVKLNIVKSDAISPSLGQEFIGNVLFIGLLAMLTVVIVVFVRYQKILISIPVVVTMLSELVILLGFAALIGWNLDLVAIAGILVAIGTGVDDQIVITDETLRKHGKQSAFLSWKDKIKNAFFIIMASYFTLVVAMLPLWFAGAGLLKGFAITTIAGVSIGVFISRPAFAVIAETLFKHDEE